MPLPRPGPKIGPGLYAQTLDGVTESPPPASFWLKTGAKWKETSVEEAKAPDYPTVLFRTIVEPPPRDADGRMGKPVPVGPPMIEHLPERR